MKFLKDFFFVSSYARMGKLENQMGTTILIK